MRIIYAKQFPPGTINKSIFLAGPTPRSSNVQSWRPEALKILKDLGYDGVVLVPETNDNIWKHDYSDQIEWEEICLNMADCILFWVPRELETLPGFTTNVEWGVWQNSGKVVFGAPEEAVKVRYQRYYADKFHISNTKTLKDTIEAALDFVGEGSLRSQGEREVPLYIWNTPHFQQWYGSQKSAGNRLDGARVKWTFRVGPRKQFVLYWALHVNVFIASENRNKTNEVFISRPDISTIFMYRPGQTIKDTDIVLIREFRSPAATVDGFVRELPGGSSFKPKGDPFELAADECSEETGLTIKPDRMESHEPRQLVATLSAHKAHLFSVKITNDELEYLKSQFGVAHGVEEETERTYVEIFKLDDLLKGTFVDWSMMGMILSVLTGDTK